MAGDFKKSGEQRDRPPGSWLSFLTGLAIGLAAAVGVYLWSNPAQMRSAAPVGQESGTAAEPALDQADSEAPMTPDVPTPKFDFYKILPEIEVKVPEEQVAEPTPPPATVEQAPNAAYMLQVASFQRFDEADQSKAQLALYGVRATIQRVVINGQDVWYRVHVGPYQSVQAAQEMRARLAQSGINAIMLKLGEGVGAER
jgi:cell division protein FtsN